MSETRSHQRKQSTKNRFFRDIYRSDETIKKDKGTINFKMQNDGSLWVDWSERKMRSRGFNMHDGNMAF